MTNQQVINRIASMPSPPLSARNPIEFASRVIEMILDALDEALPPKDEVVAAVNGWLDAVFREIDFPGPDAAIEPALRWIIIYGVERGYDWLDQQGG